MNHQYFTVFAQRQRETIQAFLNRALKTWLLMFGYTAGLFIGLHSPPLSCLTLTKPLGASVSMKTWLQASSANRSEMNLTGVAFTSCSLAHSNTGNPVTEVRLALSSRRITKHFHPRVKKMMSLFLTRSHRGRWEAGRLVAAVMWRLQGAQLWPHSRSPCAA